jgi:hypothetical protein
LESNGNFTVMTGRLTTTDPTLPHSVGGITFQNRNISAASLTINGVPYNGGVAAGVASINSLSGVVTLTAGTNISLYTSGNTIVIGVSGSTGVSSGGVTTLNTLSGAVTLVAGTNISLFRTGNNITIGVSGGSSGGVTSLNTLSGVLTLSAGTNISLFTSGSNIIIRSSISGTYGGVQLSSNSVSASSIFTPNNILSSIGGVRFQGNQLSASAVFITGNEESIISGVTLENSTISLSSMFVASSINTSNISVTGGISICSALVSSIVGTVNGYGGQITISGGTGIGLTSALNIAGPIFTIATAPTPVTIYSSPGIGPINLPNTGRGDIFLLPINYVNSGAVQLNFPVNPFILPAGISWRITNASPSNVSFLYDSNIAVLPNLDPPLPFPVGSFTLNANTTILVAKTNELNTYYNVI